MKKNNVPSNKGEQLVQFRLSDAARINNAVLAYEGGRRDRKPSTLPRAVGGGGGAGLVEAEFCGAWPKNEIKQISFASDTTRTSTANAINYLCSIQPFNTGENYYRKCIVFAGSEIALEAGADYALVNAEC